MVSRGRKIGLYSLSALLVLTIGGLVFTNRSPTNTSIQPAANPTAGTTIVVDQEPLTTARGLSNLSSTADEQQVSDETVRIADHEVDLAYAAALAEAQAEPPAENDKTRGINQQIRLLQDQVRSDQEQVDRLKKSAAGKSDSSGTQDELEVMQAQLTLHQDQLEDAKQDLIRVGGDPASGIQRQLADHEAREHIFDTAPPKVSTLPRSFETQGSLLAQFKAWRRLRSTRQQLLEAQQRALAAVELLGGRHDNLSNRDTQPANPPVEVAGQTGAAADKNASHVAALASLHRQSQNSKTLAGYDKRIQDEKQLVDLYGRWIKLVDAEVQLAQRAMLRSVLWIILALLGLVIAEGMIEAVYSGTGSGGRRPGAGRLVLRYITQVIGMLIILLVLLGVPSQFSTILALAGAGLTVALKDFIVAFFGWFVLMGSNGIRVGDWVEINGVGGEVTQIGLLRTVLLETGNWNDAGHPTGRKVAFVNSFAIEGHYFNFTTAGQWLWDEIDMLLPAGHDPDQLTEDILKIVTEDTRADASAAEQEWKRITHQSLVQSSSAAPVINIRPTNLGVNLVVRYVVQAHDRYAVRTRLYQKIVAKLQGKDVSGANAEATLPASRS